MPRAQLSHDGSDVGLALLGRGDDAVAAGCAHVVPARLQDDDVGAGRD